MISGDWKQSKGDLTILDFSGATFTGSATDISQINWVLEGSPTTTITTFGTLDFTDNILTLSGFEAFAIPEPSTGMLLFIMSGAILLRRYCQAQENRGDAPVIFARL